MRHAVAMLGLLAACSESPSGRADVPDPGVDPGPVDVASGPEDVADVAGDPDVAPIEDVVVPHELERFPDAFVDLGPELPPDGPDVAEPPPDPGPEPDLGPPLQCEAIPKGPLKLKKLKGPIASEDLAFDDAGNVVGSDDQAIFKSAYGGPPKVFVPNLPFRAALRFLPSGHLVVCDNTKGELVRFDETGAKHVVLTGLSYPNGLAVDMKGFVYLSEHDANHVFRVHPFTGEKWLLTDRIASPNGLTFSPDYGTLYIGGFNGDGIVWSMSISPDGIPGKLVAFATGIGTGWLDGMGVDACGNVYIADYGATVIYRITPDGQNASVVITADGASGAYLPNLQWGSGIGGWDPLKLYLPDGWNKGVFEVDIGVPSKPVPYP